MTIDLEAIAVSRAAEQLEAGAWRHAPPREAADPVRECLVVGCHNSPPRKRRICEVCSEQGYVGGECRICGGPLKRTDQHGPKGDLRNCCATCRADRDQDYAHFATMVHRMERDRFGRVTGINRQNKSAGTSPATEGMKP